MSGKIQKRLVGLLENRTDRACGDVGGIENRFLVAAKFPHEVDRAHVLRPTNVHLVARPPEELNGIVFDRDLGTRVEDAAQQLDYRPDLTASNLRRGTQTATLGLMLENVANPYSGAVHRAVDDAAIERGMAVLATSLDEDPVREREVARAMIQRRVDGMVIMPTGTDQSYLRPE